MIDWLARHFRQLRHGSVNSAEGLKVLWRETAFRLELLALVVLAPLGIWLGRSGTQRALLLGSLGLVILAEIVNTAFETTIDRIGTDHNELSKQAKDLGSLLVALAIVLAAVIWLLVLTSR